MIEENKFIFGIGLTIVGVLYLYFLFKRRSFKKEDAFDNSMFIKGIVGRVSLILIGLIALLMHFSFL